MVNAKQEAITVLNEALNELESSKGSVTSGVQKLLRAALILDEEKIAAWCDFHLGKSDYINPVKNYVEVLKKKRQTPEALNEQEFLKAETEFMEFKKDVVKGDFPFDKDDFNFLLDEQGGGFHSIGFIEDLAKSKTPISLSYKRSNLSQRISHVRRKAHEKSANLLNKLAYTDTKKIAFDLLKEEIDDKLLDLNPELTEKLMAAFKSVSSESSEEWSQALTSCRRLIESLADELYPPTEEQINGRKLGKEYYINRLWMFMDKAIESESNRDLAKTHVDFLGSYLQKTHKLTNKGVHTSITKTEAVKTVFHTYLLIADLLGYLDKRFVKKDTKINIHKATLDEIESILGVNRKIAKEIIKLRVEHGTLTPELLGNVQGIGSKTVAKAVELFSFDLVE
jgi:competence ComEA-like helix-hairpin-helix protein